MKIKVLNNYYTDENTYIVYDENTLSGIVIDPGLKSEDILKECNVSNIKIRYIFLTHCHYDHIEYLEPLRKKTMAKVVSSKWTSVNINDPYINYSIGGLGKALSLEKSDIILDDNEEMNIDGLNIKCILTPGHTNGGACFVVNNEVLFSGDTLFLRSIGRSDLPTGNQTELINSIKNKLYVLDENIEIYPGHGGKTSIGYEKKFNMFVRG